MRALVIILCILPASTLRLRLPDFAKIHPAEDDPKIGQAFMDAFLFPDPSADHSVWAAVKPWCVDQTKLAIIGFGDLLGFHCIFDFGNGDVFTEPVQQYGGGQKCAGQASLHKRPELNGQIVSMCDIPRKVGLHTTFKFKVVELIDKSDSVHMYNLNQTGIWHSIQTGWGNGENDRRTNVPAKKYKIAATHMFKNSGPGIIKWLEWHIARGIEHFFLYDNNSDEEDKQYTLPYEKQGIVTRIKWPYCCEGTDNNHGQRGQMNHALYKFGQVTDWLLDLDNDEFISTGGANIQDILESKVDLKTIKKVDMNSYIMQPRCTKEEFVSLENAGNKVHKLGALRFTTDCPPQMTAVRYPGKFFVSTLGAYKDGFVEETPHPGQMGVSGVQGPMHNMHVCHFRENYAKQRTNRVMNATLDMPMRFKADWDAYLKSQKSKK